VGRAPARHLNLFQGTSPYVVLVSFDPNLALVMPAFAASSWSKLQRRSSDAFLSYLPLAHIFDRAFEETVLSLGGSIGYWQGDPKALLDDACALRPTMFIAVPRILDRIHTAVIQKVRNRGAVLPHSFGCKHCCAKHAHTTL
jgi:long-chain acyl-CoA synthetase